MVALDVFAHAFGFDEKNDGAWFALGKVTAVNGSKLSVLLGGSATPTQVESYCTAAVGDVVLVVVSKGQARAIARRGGGSTGEYLPISGGSLTGQLEIPDSAVSDASQTPSANQYGSALHVTDQQGEHVGYLGLIHDTDDKLWTQLGVTRDVNGSPVYNSLWLGLKDDGTPTVYLGNSAVQQAWQKALNVLPLSGGEMTGVIVNKFSNGAIAQNTTSGTNQFLETVAQDEGGTWFGTFVQQLDASRRTRAGMVIRNMDNNGNWVQNGLNLYVAKDGTPTVSLDQPKAWQKALGLAQGSNYSTYFTPASGITVNWFGYSSWGKFVSVAMSWKSSSAISVPADGNISDKDVGTFASSIRPPMEIHGVSSGDPQCWYWFGTNGVLKVGAFEGNGSARTIAANTNIDFYATWVLTS